MTYRELRDHLQFLSDSELECQVAVISYDTPLFITHLEWNVGRYHDGVEPRQALLIAGDTE
jgi:hypothetical protein